MNPLTFNDPFTAILNELMEKRGCFAHDWQWQNAPLFVYNLSEQRESELAQWRVEHSDMRMSFPFETVRLSVTQTDADRPERGRYAADYLAASTSPDCELLYSIVRIKRMFDEGPHAKPHIIDFVLTEVNWQSREPAPDAAPGYVCKYNAMGRFDGERIQNPVNKIMEGALHSMITGAMNVLVTFAIDSMLPGTHTAIVKPDQPGRSVQWLQARQHYTLISHGHPANRADIGHGATVRVDQRLELQRMAHARRAHFRTLRADRYRFAKGKQVFVRSSWVGPREWRDAGSRQIYRILEPVEASNKTQ